MDVHDAVADDQSNANGFGWRVAICIEVWRLQALLRLKIPDGTRYSGPGRKGSKIVFHAKDVAALCAKLVAHGAKFGKVREGDEFCLRDGKDPDGNPIQLSNR
jgi:hypothetical protein